MGKARPTKPITRPPARAGRPCTPARPCVLSLTAPSWQRGQAGGRIGGTRSAAGLRLNEGTRPRHPAWLPKCPHLPPGPWGGRASLSGDVVCGLDSRVGEVRSVCDLPADHRTRAPWGPAGLGLWASGGGGPEGTRRKGGGTGTLPRSPGAEGKAMGSALPRAVRSVAEGQATDPAICCRPEGRRVQLPRGRGPRGQGVLGTCHSDILVGEFLRSAGRGWSVRRGGPQLP